MKHTLLLLLAGVAACSSTPGSPVAPFVFAELSGPHRLEGQVLSTPTRTPLPGATIRLSGSGATTLVTDSDGRFVAPSVPSGSIVVEMSAPGHLDRRLYLDVGGSSELLTLDQISQAPPFDLEFYRMFGRNSLGSPSLHTLSPWQASPKFYVRTVTVDEHELVDQETLSATERLIRTSVPELSAGRLVAAEVVFGSEARDREDGWVNIQFVSTPSFMATVLPNAFGAASLGGPTGWAYVLYSSLTRSPDTYSGACASAVVRVIEHELVHVMGFGHTRNLEQDFWTPDCSGQGRSAIARHHAAIVYSRRPGNRDIDDDRAPWTVQYVTAPATVTCSSSDLGLRPR